MVVVLTIKETSYLVVGLFDDLAVRFRIYICDGKILSLLCFNLAIACKGTMPLP